jgi:Holliday junction resolvase RusA-like endonuclease
MTTEFFMSMSPPTTTHQQKKVSVVRCKKTGKHVPVFYEPEDLANARSKLMSHLSQHTPEKMFSGPTRLIVKWCFPLIKGKTDGQWKDTVPDVGNTAKLLMDCMTATKYWKDDAIVSSLIEEHFWAKVPGIYIKIEEVE